MKYPDPGGALRLSLVFDTLWLLFLVVVQHDAGVDSIGIDNIVFLLLIGAD